MTKNEALEMFKKGTNIINGVECRFKFMKVLDQDDFMEIIVPAINPYTTDVVLGNKWFSYTTDEEWEKLDDAVVSYINKMKEYEKTALKEPLELVVSKKQIGNEQIVLSTPERKGRRYYAVRQFKDHFDICSIHNNEADCPIFYPVVINGAVYRPIWSWYLGHGCFKGEFNV